MFKDIYIKYKKNYLNLKRNIRNKEVSSNTISHYTTGLSGTPQACLGRPSLWSPALEPLEPSFRAFGKLCNYIIYH